MAEQAVLSLSLSKAALRRSQRLVSMWIVIVALALSLAACGKKGPPEPPDPQSDNFPRQYPDPDSL
jgi:predicted small lipoprotein YifL